MPPSTLPLATAPALPAARRRRFPFAAVGLAAALVIFGWGILHLFELRLSGGDVYPPYSTLRKDPLGAAVFHDALAALPGLTVERNVRPLASLAQPSRLRLGQLATPDPAASGTGPLACFYLGADAYEWPYLFRHNEWERLDAILRQGGRVVLTFLPVQNPLTEKRLEKLRRDQSDDETDAPADGPFQPKATPGPPGKTPVKPLPSPTPKDGSRSPAKTPARRPTPAALRRENLVDRWGIDFQREGKPTRDVARTNAKPSPAPTVGHDENPGLARPVAGGPWTGAGDVSWHSALGFDPDATEAHDAGWRTLYRQGTRPVIVARPVGDRGGELILASDSYFLSNEALRAEPRPGLLADLIGPARRVIFDETHLGIAEQPGMMTLARRYHLQGGLAALGLLAVLFLWRNVASLVPPPVPLAGGFTAAPPVVGRDAGAGFLNLLRRGVSSKELIQVCFAQWQHAPSGPAPGAATVARLRVLAAEETARPGSRRSPATAYRAMCAALKVRL